MGSCNCVRSQGADEIKFEEESQKKVIIQDQLFRGCFKDATLIQSMLRTLLIRKRMLKAQEVDAEENNQAAKITEKKIGSFVYNQDLNDGIEIIEKESAQLDNGAVYKGQ